jgi:predicted nucleic acid-binding Zn ribbon protein
MKTRKRKNKGKIIPFFLILIFLISIFYLPMAHSIIFPEIPGQATIKEITDVAKELGELTDRQETIQILEDNIEKLEDKLKELEEQEKLLEAAEIEKELKEKEDALKEKIEEEERKIKEKAEEIEEQEKREQRKWMIFQDPVDAVVSALTALRSIIMATSLINDAGHCSAEEPLKGLDAAKQEAACKSCNEDPFRTCSRARCEILGNCIPVPPEDSEIEQIEDIGNYLCVPGKCEDTGTVSITNIEAIFYAGGEEILIDSEPNSKLIISEQVEFNVDSIKIEIKTDKLAQCRYSLEPQSDFEEMTNFENNYFPGKIGEPDPQEVIMRLPGSMPRGEQHTIYIKCNNICGEAHDKYDDNHYVQFTFEQKPDQLPPIIVYIDPENQGVVSGDLTRLTLQFNLDENGYCKYSDNYTLDQNQNPDPLTVTWENMVKFGDLQGGTNSAVIGGICKQNQECPDLRTNECAHCLLELDLTKGYTEYDWEQISPELQEELELGDITKFFHFKIRCADLPQENKMTEEDTLDYSFFTMPPYEMELVKPEDYSLTYDVNPEIHVTSDERNTNCKYEVKKLTDSTTSCPNYSPNWDEMIYIDEILAKEHHGIIHEELEPSISGTPYCIFVKCRDSWLLERDDSHYFKVLKDVVPPRIIRMYHDVFAGDYLLIEANEESTCVYGVDDEIACNFEFDEANEMTGTNETIHTAYWTLDHLYYIRCMDKWGNVLQKGQCTIVINPFEIPAIPF